MAGASHSLPASPTRDPSNRSVARIPAWSSINGILDRNVAGGVTSFQWSPDGRRIAFLTRVANKGSFESQRSKDSGVVINKWDFVIYKLLNNTLFLELDRTSELSVIDAATRNVETIPANGSVSQFAWSPDSKKLAIMAHPANGAFAIQRDDAEI